MDMTHSSRALTPFVRRTKVLRWPFKLVLFTSAPGLSLTQLVFAPTMCLHIYERLEARTCHLLLLSFATNPTYLAAPVLFSPLAQSTESNSDLYRHQQDATWMSAGGSNTCTAPLAGLSRTS